MEEAIERYAQDHDYENWLLKDLIDLCKKRGLSCTRSKHDIIVRLIKDDTEFLKRVKKYNEQYGTNFSQSNREKWLNRVNLEKLNCDQLKDQCRYRNINVSGDREKICCNIRNHDIYTLERIKSFMEHYM